MSDEIHSVGDNQEPPPSKDSSDKKGDGGIERVPACIKTPPNKPAPKGENGGFFTKLKDWVEIVTFIFIILTFWEMRNTRMADERAWLFPYCVVCKTNTVAPATAMFEVYFKNTGKSPALNVRCWTESEAFTNSPNIPDVDLFTNLPASIVAPDTKFTGNLGPVPLDGINNSFKAGASIYIWGTVWYDDIFGKHHWSQYCVKANETLDAFAAQGFHNKCDAN